jgi:hypothetical protein
MALWKIKTLKLLLIVAMVPLLNVACHVNRVSKAQRQAVKLDKEVNRTLIKEYEKAKKEHQKIQTKETLKRMKQLEKRSRQLNKPRR